MANVSLVNKTKRPPRMLTYNLTKEVDPIKVTNRLREESKDGVRRIRVVNKIVPGSIRIPAGSQSKPIDEKVLKCPEVAAGLKRREFTVNRSVPVAKKSDTKGGDGKQKPKPRQRRRGK